MHLMFILGDFKSSSPFFSYVLGSYKSVNRSQAKGDLVIIQTLLLLNANYFVIMLTRYWSLSQQGDLQPHSKSKTWQLSTQL